MLVIAAVAVGLSEKPADAWASAATMPIIKQKPTLTIERIFDSPLLSAGMIRHFPYDLLPTTIAGYCGSFAVILSSLRLFTSLILPSHARLVDSDHVFLTVNRLQSEF